MKLPKKISIAGMDWKIVCDKELLGGRFDTNTMEIVIGTQLPQFVPVTLLHEVLEALCTLRGLRYDHGMKMLFVMTHNEFEQICYDFSYVLGQIAPRWADGGKE